MREIEKKKYIYCVGIMARWARKLGGGLSTPRSWPLGVQFEGGERGALVDKVKKKELSITILSSIFAKMYTWKSVKTEEKNLSLCSVGVELSKMRKRLQTLVINTENV